MKENKLPQGTVTPLVDYSHFNNPDSIRKFDECSDYSQFDFNEFFKTNPIIQRQAVNHITMCINHERSRKASQIPIPLEEGAEANAKYLTDNSDLYKLGKTRIFSELTSGEEFSFNENHRILIQELAEVLKGANYHNKPLIMSALHTISVCSDNLSRCVDNFPRHTQNGLKRDIRQTIYAIKEYLVKIMIRGHKESSIYTLLEKIVLLRFNIEEARINNYFDRNNETNNRKSVFLQELTGKLENIARSFKEALGTKQ